MPNVDDSIQVDGSQCRVLYVTSEDRVIVELEPGIYAVAVRIEGTWSAMTGEPGDEAERAELAQLVAATPDTLTVTKS